MILYPAIDIKDRRCVRLLRGAMDRVTVYADDPAEQARRFRAEGCEWLHLVDLNGAVSGYPANGDAIGAVLATVTCPVQVGGGIRDMATVKHWLDRGVARVILGTAAVEDPDFVGEAAASFPGRVAVGIDARDGRVATRGWLEDTGIPAVELALRFENAGVAAIIYTDIDRDGAMQGPNVEATALMADTVGIPVIASGGISSLADLSALGSCGAPLDGAIVGRALYSGAIDLAEALAVARAMGAP
ncbi:MAG: 1-(5-phosphoribosyl)-5-[(5-phosphoribosylamino)methylideneamino]imidazole-4-carboxamide isomerase [Rhodobacter sp.]|nr:1-(5-phosphoribosyl)-5-[(5-phosphoribosylamino)methylideneamino]imidazole-4-carboxamide isomerase [Rhodobacter sp.]